MGMKYRSNYWKLSVLIVCTMLSKSIYATDYYVSSSGSDGNSGTSIGNAWATIAKVNSTNFLPGDALFFEGGKTFTGSITITSADANNPNNIFTISSFGTGRAIINAGSSYGFYAYNTQGFSISNLIFDGNNSSTNSDAGIKLKADAAGDIKFSNITMSNIEIKNFGAEGVSIYGANHLTGYKNVTLDNVIVHNVTKNGIKIYGDITNVLVGWQHANVTVTNCEVYNVPGSGSTSTLVLEGNGIVLAGVDGGIIEHSVAHDNGQNNKRCGGPVGIWSLESNNITIQYCESYLNHSGTGCDGGGFDFDGGMTNSLMQYNYSHDNDGSGILFGQYDGARPWSNNTFRYNISENDAKRNNGSIGVFKSSFSSTGPMKGAYIYNNTIFTSPQAANSGVCAVNFQLWSSAFTNVDFYNNIFYTTGGVPLIITPPGYTAKFAGNIYWSSGSTFSIKYSGTNYSSLNAWRSATGNEIVNGNNTGFNTDPQLINPGLGGTIGFGNSLNTLNAYKIQSGQSSASNTALDLNTLFGINVGNSDFWGTMLPGGSNNSIGGNQFSNTLPVELVNFYGNCSNDAQNIFWTTADEINVRTIDLLVSSNERDFEKIAEFNPKGSNSNYSYTNDSAGAGTNYYQLRMTDSDGTVNYSSILNISCDQLSDLVKIGPNPFGQFINVYIESESEGAISFTLYDGVGKTVFREKTNVYNGDNLIRLYGVGALSSGMYYLQISKNNKLYYYKLIKGIP
jgi:hypothetical protein